MPRQRKRWLTWWLSYPAPVGGDYNLALTASDIVEKTYKRRLVQEREDFSVWIYSDIPPDELKIHCCFTVPDKCREITLYCSYQGKSYKLCCKSDKWDCRNPIPFPQFIN